MTANQYTGKVSAYMAPFLSKNGYSEIRTEFVSEDNNWYLRMFIDLTEDEFNKRKAELEAAEAEDREQTAESDDEPDTPGVSINDCVKVSRYLSKWLDKEDFIKEAYTLEVCSQGFMRKELTEEKDTEESDKGENK